MSDPGSTFLDLKPTQLLPVKPLEKEVRTGDSADCVIAVMCTQCTIAKILLESNSNSTA